MKKILNHNWKLTYQDEDQTHYVDVNNISYDTNSANFAYIWVRQIFNVSLDSDETTLARDLFAHIDWGNSTCKELKSIFYSDKECKNINFEDDEEDEEYTKITKEESN